MLDFIVLGLIPGTDIRITFNMVLVFSLALGLAFAFHRKFTQNKHLMTVVNKILQLSHTLHFNR